jgi:hypothetical protein
MPETLRTPADALLTPCERGCGRPSNPLRTYCGRLRTACVRPPLYPPRGLSPPHGAGRRPQQGSSAPRKKPKRTERGVATKREPSSKLSHRHESLVLEPSQRLNARDIPTAARAVVGQHIRQSDDKPSNYNDLSHRVASMLQRRAESDMPDSRIRMMVRSIRDRHSCPGARHAGASSTSTSPAMLAGIGISGRGAGRLALVDRSGPSRRLLRAPQTEGPRKNARQYAFSINSLSFPSQTIGKSQTKFFLPTLPTIGELR